jgi:hypothetical protein
MERSMSTVWTDCYRAHFQRHFAKPFDIQVFHDTDGFALKLAIHDLAAQSYRVYASMGLADKLIANEEEDFGEVILYADVPDREVPQLFMRALFFILHNDIPLASRFAIGGIESMYPQFARRYGKSALYFTLAAAEDDSFNKVRNGEDFGRVFQAYFIAPDEDCYLEEHGPEAFEKLLEIHRNEAPRLERRESLLTSARSSTQIQPERGHIKE